MLLATSSLDRYRHRVLYVENSCFVEGEGTVNGIVLYHTRFCITHDSILGK